MSREISELMPSYRILLGPGPSNIDSRVLKAMSTPLLGFMDPEYLKIMDDCVEMLRYIMETQNKVTLPVPGTGMAGMETILSNLIEPGDKVLVVVSGFFSERMCEVVERNKGELIRLDTEWGQIINLDDIKTAIKKYSPQLVAIVHAETSTGVLQPVEGIGYIAREHDALLVIDAVTSLGGLPVKVDNWMVDAIYSGSQKCLGCPPGLAPVSFNDRAMDKIMRRKRKVSSFYLDINLLYNYWGGDQRAYHHTGPVSLIYAFYEALRIIYKEGLQVRFIRHQNNSDALVAGLRAMGLETFVQEEYRLPTLTTIKIPEGIYDDRIRKRLIKEFNIEIGAGLGKLAGKIWRIGLMGSSSTKNNVIAFLGALEKVLISEGCKVPTSGVSEAIKVFIK